MTQNTGEKVEVCLMCSVWVECPLNC